jgi:hypothetical protein
VSSEWKLTIHYSQLSTHQIIYNLMQRCRLKSSLIDK